jgi:hypothetical protein
MRDHRVVCAVLTAGLLSACDTPSIDSVTTTGAPLAAACATPECAEITPTGFRVRALEIVDPHLYARILFACTDVTGQVNDRITDELRSVAEDGQLLKRSIVAGLSPLDPGAPETPITLGLADCTAPYESTECIMGPTHYRVDSIARNQSAGTCMQPIPGTTNDAYDAPVAPEAPCFATDAQNLVIDFEGLRLPLSDARLAARYGNGELTRGLVRGFLSLQDARTLILPSNIPIVGGRPFSDLLTGGTGGCQGSGDDRDTGPAGEPGWYFYLNVEASQVPFAMSSAAAG